MKYAILIDAGFIKRKLGSRTTPLSAARVAGFIAAIRAHEAVVGMRLHRIYWYDAPPLQHSVRKPLCGGTVDFSVTSLGRASARLESALCRAPLIAVRRGELVFRGWKIKQGRLPDGDSTVLEHSDLLLNVPRVSPNETCKPK